MTIDISIGKLKILTWKEVLNDKLSNQYSFSYKDHINIIDFLEIEQCPNEIDGCTEDDTIFPNSAYRSGSISAISSFFNEVIPEIIDEMRPNKSNDRQICFIEPFLEAINKINYNGSEDMHKKRLHWFKFWCNRAVELYGEKAVIEFS